MNKWTEQQLEAMAEAYFEGTLSEQEEATLKERLAASPTTTGAIGDAKALMGFFATMRKQSRRTRPTRRLRRAAYIASIASCAALIVLGIWRYSALQSHDCIMYASGQVITSEEQVVAAMNSQISEMKSPSKHIEGIVRSQLGDFGQLIGNK